LGGGALARGKIKETASATFHTFTRFADTDHAEERPWTLRDFAEFSLKLKNLSPLNEADPEIAKRVKNGLLVPIANQEVLDERTFFGSFEGAYSGHEFRNSKKGVIGADTVNHRPFYFLLYLKSDGTIVVSTQYLGFYGDYSGLKATLFSLLGEHAKIETKSIISDLDINDGVNIKGVQVDYLNVPKNTYDTQLSGTKTAYVVSRQRGEVAFGDIVKGVFGPLFTSPEDSRRSKLANILKTQANLTVRDEDIIECKFLADFNGKDVTIRLFDGGVMATRFPMTTQYEDNGHPRKEITKSEMIRLLTKHALNA
jgi:hypothetical protein